MAEATFHSNLLDMGVQMVPKTCTAIQKYVERRDKRIE